MRRPDRIDTLALLLLAGTAVSVLVAEQGAVAPHAGLVALVLLLSLVKGALVALDFMELRQAPPRWRRLLLGWLLGVLALIALAMVGAA